MSIRLIDYEKNENEIEFDEWKIHISVTKQSLLSSSDLAASTGRKSQAIIGEFYIFQAIKFTLEIASRYSTF